MRIGILGGAFNPPHLGHLVCAQEAYAALDLDRVLFVPVGKAPHRELEPEPGADLRHALCVAAVEDDERFTVSRAELDRPGRSYTVDTLSELRSSAPDDELFLILGADQAAELGSWHRPAEILRLATVCVAERAGIGRSTVSERLASLEGAASVTFFSMPEIAISSTLVRERLQSQMPVRYLVPEAVAGLITQHGLYQLSTHSRL